MQSFADRRCVMGERRVYVLPTDLHERVIGFMRTSCMNTEVEAVRALLEKGLVASENEHQLRARLLSMTAIDAAREACGHPLVESIHAVGVTSYIINLLNGGEIQIGGAS